MPEQDDTLPLDDDDVLLPRLRRVSRAAAVGVAMTPAAMEPAEDMQAWGNPLVRVSARFAAAAAAAAGVMAWVG